MPLTGDNAIDKTINWLINQGNYLSLLHISQLHPDRQQEDKENFTVKFQYLHQIYTLLSDLDRRKEYDEDGTLSQDDNLPVSKHFDLHDFRRYPLMVLVFCSLINTKSSTITFNIVLQAIPCKWTASEFKSQWLKIDTLRLSIL